jgi:hypothetical protein
MGGIPYKALRIESTKTNWKTQEKRTIPTNIENKTKLNMTLEMKKKAKTKGQP